jgi:cyclohexa-1,5-dienecarbonyl-CoA hydratase
VAHLILAAPKANIVDRTMLDDLNHHLDDVEQHAGLRAVVLRAEGPHFSFGASIEEHLPDAIAATLRHLHATIRRLHELPAPTIAVVQGQCLGGGLELVLACDLVLAEEGAVFACPEIQLGVFAPAASTLLPWRVRGGDATHLLLTGGRWSAEVAVQKGLVDRLVPKGQHETGLQQWLDDDFAPRSAVGLRCASQAARRLRKEALERDLHELEHLYLDTLMASPDGVEGIQAFLEKRTPTWREGISNAS